MESLEPLLFCYNLSDNSAGISADYLDLKITCLSMLKTCGLIYQKKDNENIIVSIVMEQWISFLSRYEFLKGLSPRILWKYKFLLIFLPNKLCLKKPQIINFMNDQDYQYYQRNEVYEIWSQV